MTISNFRFAVIVFCCAGCTVDESSPTEPALIRTGNLIVNVADIDVCWNVGQATESIAANLGSDASMAYPAMTNYMQLPLSQDAIRVALVPRGSGCAARPLVETTVERRDDGEDARFRTLVLLGDADDGIVGFEAVLLADETDSPPTSGAKARNFHADPEAPNIDVGVGGPGAAPIRVFRDVAYRNTARATDLGEVSPRGYVSGIPSVALPITVWQAGTDTGILRFDDAPPFEAGVIYSIFPAGKVSSGQAEAFACVDEVTMTVEAPLAACDLLIPTVL